jgi:DNA polymerase-3 subunit beta
MKLTIPRANLLSLLQKVIGVVERKQTLPILSNVLIRCSEGRLSLSATDLEMELIAGTALDVDLPPLTITAPARKLLDICRSLEEGSNIDLQLEGDKLRVHSGKTRFSLATLPADNFPSFEALPTELRFAIDGVKLRRVIEQSMFAMAQQDVRFYLNGLLLEVEGQALRAVASDGHRLAYCEQTLEDPVDQPQQVILPRKGVSELYRLLDNWSDDVGVCLGDNTLRVLLGDTVFSVKLVDARYPDYRRVIPSNISRVVEVEKDALKQALSRVFVVCEEKFRNIRFEYKANNLTVSASSPEHEEASDEVDIVYGGDFLETAYNGSYLMDALNHLSGEQVRFGLSDGNAACVIEADSDADSRFVVMPLRL